MRNRQKGSVYEFAGQAGLRNTGDAPAMLTLPILAKLSSAAVAAALTASITYGQYTIASGPNGSGLMPPASVLHPWASTDAVLDPLAEMMQALGAMKQEQAKSARNRAMVDWLASLRADFTVERFDSGLVYKVRYAPDGDAGEVLEDYVAVPYGPEMSFAVTLKAADAGAVTVEGVSCTAQQIFRHVDISAGTGAAQAEAMSQAEAYLAAPDAADPSLPADCLTARLKRG